MPVESPEHMPLFMLYCVQRYLYFVKIKNRFVLLDTEIEVMCNYNLFSMK